MDTIQLVSSDPTLIYLLLVLIISTITLIVIRYFKQRNKVQGTELIESIVENVRFDAGQKFNQRLSEKKNESLVPKSDLVIPMPAVKTPRESHKKIDELIEDDNDESDSSNLVI